MKVTKTLNSVNCPLFIGGMFKSGTTLLRTMLSQHSMVFSGLETYWFEIDWEMRHLNPTAERLELTRRMYDVPNDQYSEILRNSNCAEDYLTNLMSYCMERKKKSRWLEKTPGNITNVDRILTYWPNARVIHIIRDPRDIFASLLEAKKWDSVGEFITRWAAVFHSIAEYENDYSRYAGSILTVRYENLVLNPINTMQSLMDFLPLPFEISVASFEGSVGDYNLVKKLTGRDSTTLQRLASPLSNARVGIWRDLLTDRVRASLQTEAESLGRRKLSTCVLSMMLSNNKLLVLTYHYVRPETYAYPGIHPMSPEELDVQIRRIKEALNSPTILEVEDFLSGRSNLRGNSFLTTFDDGLKDHHQYVRRILKKHDLQAVFFVQTSAVADGVVPTVHKIHWVRSSMAPSDFVLLFNKHLPQRWRQIELTEECQSQARAMHIHDDIDTAVLKYTMNFILPPNVVRDAMNDIYKYLAISEREFCDEYFLNQNEILDLHKDGHIIGLHGHSHIALSRFTQVEADLDLERNKDIIRKITKSEPVWMSYPYGRRDALPANTADFLSRNKLKFAFTMLPGAVEHNCASHSICRITPNELCQYMDMPQ